MSVFICRICNHIEFQSASENCPVCFAAKASFAQNDNVFKESAEKSKEGAVKHIPFVKVVKECGLVPGKGCIDILVRIGEIVHPMEDAHFIKFIDCYVDRTYISRVLLTPGVYAAGCFHLKAAGKSVQIVENCNLHGHWMAEAAL